MKRTKTITISEELFDTIIDELNDGKAFRMNSDSHHIDTVDIGTTDKLHEAWEEGTDV